MQTLVPLETAPFEKETIVCCTDFKDADEKTNHSLRGKTKEKANMSECQTPTDAKLTPKIKKRHSWILAKRSPLQQRPRRHHSQNHSFSYLSTDNSAHHQQKYNQEKMDLIKQGLCGSSSSCLVASPSLSDDHLSSSTNNNQLASLLFSSLISSCTSTSNSSSFSFLNALKESTVVSHSILPAEDPPRRRPRSVISSPGTSISSSSKTMGSKVHSWWKRRWTAAAPRDLNCHHHNHAEFLAFRYPKMIPFQKLRDTALQLLLSSDTNRCSDDSIQQDKSPSFSELPSSWVNSPLPLIPFKVLIKHAFIIWQRNIECCT